MIVHALVDLSFSLSNLTFCLNNKCTFDICMKKFVAKNIEKMAVMSAYTKSIL